MRTDIRVELVPDPQGTTISARINGRIIGHLAPETSQQWTGVVRRVIASGMVPVTASDIWANEFTGWDGPEFRAVVRIALGDPAAAIPLNAPPTVPYTLLPKSSIVQVTKEDQYFDTLRELVPPSGHGAMFATLHERPPATGRGKPVVEVRIDNETVGQLTAPMSQRYLPMLQHLQARGLIAACWSDITGSAVAAEVRINAAKANEVEDTTLDGPPITVPKLVTALDDPDLYDISMTPDPLPPRNMPARQLPVEPPDGSVVRFTMGRNGQYTYLAIRIGASWQTTSTVSDGSITEVMSWHDLASKAGKFEIAQTWTPIRHPDHRTRTHDAVIWFTIGGIPAAAVNIADSGDNDGDWYPTVAARIALGSYVEWSDIARAADGIRVASGWVPSG